MPDSISSSITQSLNALKHNVLVIGSNGVIRFANVHWEEFNQLYGISDPSDWLELSVLELFRERLADAEGMMKLEHLLLDIFQETRLASSIELDILTMSRGSRIFRLELFLLITEQITTSQTAILTLRDIGPSAPVVEPVSPTPVTRTPGTLYLHKKNQCLVPICAACKSVRNIQQEWISIERFLQAQLSLQFTHDICPDCIRELYPKYAAALKW